MRRFRGPLKIWDFETGRELLTLPVPGQAQFTPDGTRLIVAGLDGTALLESSVRMFLVQTEDLVALAKKRVTRSLTEAECQQYLHVEACPQE